MKQVEILRYTVRCGGGCSCFWALGVDDLLDIHDDGGIECLEKRPAGRKVIIGKLRTLGSGVRPTVRYDAGI